MHHPDVSPVTAFDYDEYWVIIGAGSDASLLGKTLTRHVASRLRPISLITAPTGFLRPDPDEKTTRAAGNFIAELPITFRERTEVLTGTVRDRLLSNRSGSGRRVFAIADRCALKARPFRRFLADVDDLLIVTNVPTRYKRLVWWQNGPETDDAIRRAARSAIGFGVERLLFLRTWHSCEVGALAQKSGSSKRASSIQALGEHERRLQDNIERRADAASSRIHLPVDVELRFKRADDRWPGYSGRQCDDLFATCERNRQALIDGDGDILLTRTA